MLFISQTFSVSTTAHAFRRFRVTRLRKQRAPEEIIRFWLSHSNRIITDDYFKMAEDVEFRKQVEEQVGVGFQLPPTIAPRIQFAPKKSKLKAQRKMLKSQGVEHCAPVAQLDRASGYEPEGRRFDSSRARHSNPGPARRTGRPQSRPGRSSFSSDPSLCANHYLYDPTTML
jgi:hypothetical protein